MRATYLCLGIWIAGLTYPSVGEAQRPLPGDRLLALTSADYAKASREETIRRIDAVLAHLGLPRLSDSAFAGIKSSIFEKMPQYEERDELSNTVLIVKGAVKLGFVREAVIIADGDVHIAHVARSIVATTGSISVSHENPHLAGSPAGGLYFAKGSIQFSHCTTPSFYALKGAVAPCAATGFNTDIKKGSTLYIGRISKMGGPPLFLGEPRRSGQGSMLVSTGEQMGYSGARCPNAPDLVDLHSALLPSARKRANCPRIDSAAVSCVAEANGDPYEKWTFSLCGRSISMYSAASPIAVPKAPSEPGTHASISILTEEEMQRQRSLRQKK